MIDYGKYSILGVRIDAVDYEAAVEKIVWAARDSRPMAVSAMCVHVVMTGVLDRVHRFRLNEFEMSTPDGQPVRWALRWLHGVRLPNRVYGPELMLKVCQRAADEQLPVFFFGGTAETLAALTENLSSRFPRLPIAGTRCSKFRRLSPDESQETIAAIRGSGAAITFVGLGCPRQEVWAFEHRSALSMPVVAVGGAFNIHAKQVPQAPHFLQDHGLEWAYRLSHEPGRLWKRYLLLNPLYLACLLLQATGLKRFDPNSGFPPSEEVSYG